MTKLNFDRPYLQLLDDFRKQRSRLAGKGAGTAGLRLLKEDRAGTDHVGLSRPQERKLVHRIAVSMLAHMAKYGDVRIINRLLDEVKEELEKEALIAWFCKYGNVSMDDGNRFRLSGGKIALDAADKHPYWKGIRKDAGKPGRKRFDFRAELMRLVGRATEAAVRREDASHVDMVLLENVRRLLKD